MKLKCSVAVTLNMNPKRSELSYLIIGGYPNDKAVYIIHQTNKNRSGTKYKIDNNVDKIFFKYAAAGKITINLKVPPVSLAVRGDPADVKKFLVILQKRERCADWTDLSRLTAAKNIKKENCTSLSISKSTDMPKDGFPRSLVNLEMHHLGLTTVPPRVLRLQQLRVLNLSYNSLETLPTEIDLLPALEHLNLGHNEFGRGTSWRWLASHFLRGKLLELDLSHNQMTRVPFELSRLYRLEILHLDGNDLNAVPFSMCSLPNLKVLSLADNYLNWLPVSIRQRHSRLQYLDVSMNPFILPERRHPTNDWSNVSLAVLSAFSVLKNQLKYEEVDLPQVLCHYLDSLPRCFCGSPSFPGGPASYESILRHEVASVVQCDSRYQFISLSYKHCWFHSYGSNPTSY